MKRILQLSLAAVVVLLAGGVGTYFYIGRQGSSDLEQWIGQQLVAVIENQITPKVTFESLDYQAPFTVVIEKLALTGEGRAIISIERALLELAEVPSRGQPIHIKNIDLAAPHIILAQRPAGGLVGWSDFVRSKQDREAAPAGERLSDVLRLRHVGIRDGQIVYDAADGSTPMTLPGIQLDLDTPPAGNAPGAYKLAGTLKRDPVFKLDFDGQIDLDAGRLDVGKADLTCDLGEEQYETLPPGIQKILRDHQVRGRLTVALAGQMQLADPSQSTGTLRAELGKASVRFGETFWPVERLLLTADAKAGKANAKLEAAALSGSVRSDARITLADRWPAELTWELTDLRIEDALRALEGGQPRYAGRLSGSGQAKAELTAMPASLGGPGRLEVREGHLVHIKIIRDILQLGAKKPPTATPSKRDTADVRFELKPDRVEITEASVDSSVLRLRGKGPIFYDQRLDLNVRAGVLENVADAFGQIGSLVGKVTEQAIQYHVTGMLSDPKVALRPGVP